MIYLDHHAATPPSPAARAAMEAARQDGWANPSSPHAAGRRARRWLEGAREQVAAALGAEAPDVVLTGGGTEAVSLGVLGLAAGRRRVVVTTAVEHPAVARAVDRLQASGARVHRLPVAGGLPPELPPDLLDTSTLVATQWVNHETGNVMPVGRWAAECRATGAALVLDATQAFGKIPVDLAELGATAVAVASHKMGGPAGAGALWVSRGADVAPVLAGGQQERGRRPGSPDVVALAGFGAAAAEVAGRLAAMPEVARLRDRLEEALVRLGAVVNGADGPRVATVTNASVRGWRGEHLVAALDVEGVCVASGAACSSGLSEPSPVVGAMYPDAPPWRAEGALRASLAPSTTAAEIDAAIAVLQRVLPRGTNLG